MHQQVIHQHQAAAYRTSWDEMYYRNTEGKIAHGKLAQAVAYGAEIISIEGNFDDALKAVRNIAAEEPITLVNSVNPYRIEGQKRQHLKFVTNCKMHRMF